MLNIELTFPKKLHYLNVPVVDGYFITDKLCSESSIVSSLHIVEFDGSAARSCSVLPILLSLSVPPVAVSQGQRAHESIRRCYQIRVLGSFWLVSSFSKLNWMDQICYESTLVPSMLRCEAASNKYNSPRTPALRWQMTATRDILMLMTLLAFLFLHATRAIDNVLHLNVSEGSKELLDQTLASPGWVLAIRRITRVSLSRMRLPGTRVVRSVFACMV